MKQIKGEILIENYTWDMFHHAPLSIRQEDCKHNQPPLNPKPSNLTAALVVAPILLLFRPTPAMPTN